MFSWARLLNPVFPASVGLMTVAGLVAQTRTPPRFEVAAVKPAATDELGSEINVAPGGRVTIANLPLKSIIVYAWGLKPFQVSGAKGWMESQRYDIVAKPESKPAQAELLRMLQSLLAERFGLVVHNETRELPIYALVVSKPGKLGPGLVPFQQGSCPEFDPGSPPPPSQTGAPSAVPCGRIRSGRTGIRGAGVRVADLIDRLSPLLGRIVLDETGLSEKYDINLQWPSPASTPVSAASSDAAGVPQSDDGSPVFRALDEQLGLKLRLKKGPVEILVVDQAVQPQGN